MLKHNARSIGGIIGAEKEYFRDKETDDQNPFFLNKKELEV